MCHVLNQHGAAIKKKEKKNMKKRFSAKENFVEKLQISTNTWQMLKSYKYLQTHGKC